MTTARKIFITLSILMGVATAFVIASPTYAIDGYVAGGSTISVGGEYGVSSLATGIITVSTTDPVTVVGTGETYNDLRINVTMAGSDITIEDLNITQTNPAYYAISFTGLGNVLRLAGSSTITEPGSVASSGQNALIRVNDGTSLTITGTGALDISARAGAAAIGGDFGTKRGSITISGVTNLTASTYSAAAAVGSGYGDTAVADKEIIIENSTVVINTYANSGLGDVPGGAGIGGGVLSVTGKITIFNSNITGTATQMGAFIGTGMWGSRSNINIIDSYINATAASYGSVIGDGRGVASGYALNSVINISGSEIIANNTYTGATGSAAIGGGGFYNYYSVYGGPASAPTINITNSTVTASVNPGNYAAAIGSGSNNGGSDTTSISTAINITDSVVTANGGHSAAIGGGYRYSAGNITISGDDTVVTATSGTMSAGIGGGYGAGDTIMSGGTLMVSGHPIIYTYSDKVDSAIAGVTVVELASDARIVHGSLHSSLVSATAQTIYIRSFADDSEEYTLTLPANYVSFATNTLGTAADGQYFSQIVSSGGNTFTLARIDGGNREYIYELADARIYRIIELQITALVCIDINISGDSSEVSCEAVSPEVPLPIPATPTRAGFSFVGWTIDQAGQYPVDWDSDPIVLADITIFAQWEPVDGGGTLPPATGILGSTFGNLVEADYVVAVIGAVGVVAVVACLRRVRRIKR